jgi:hypothetical protein
MGFRRVDEAGHPIVRRDRANVPAQNDQVVPASRPAENLHVPASNAGAVRS